MSDRTEELLTELRNHNDHLTEVDSNKILKFYDVMRRYAPHLASDPVIAAAWINNAATMGEVHVSAIKELCEAEKSHRAVYYASHDQKYSIWSAGFRRGREEALATARGRAKGCEEAWREYWNRRHYGVTTPEPEVADAQEVG